MRVQSWKPQKVDHEFFLPAFISLLDLESKNQPPGWSTKAVMEMGLGWCQNLQKRFRVSLLLWQFSRCRLISSAAKGTAYCPTLTQRSSFNTVGAGLQVGQRPRVWVSTSLGCPVSLDTPFSVKVPGCGGAGEGVLQGVLHQQACELVAPALLHRKQAVTLCSSCISGQAPLIGKSELKCSKDQTCFRLTPQVVNPTSGHA